MEYTLTFDEYNRALKKNRLLGLKCTACDAVIAPPVMICPACGAGALEVTELGGRGIIQTFTVNFVAALGRECEVPYTVVLVELDEGPWIMGNLVDVDPAVVNMDIIGKRVKMGENIGARLFPGDAYSAGDAARPLFQFE